MGIKLRVRVVGGSGDTIRVEVPEVCTLAQLRSALATKVFEGNVEPANVAVTLNRADDVTTQGSGEGSTLRIALLRAASHETRSPALSICVSNSPGSHSPFR